MAAWRTCALQEHRHEMNCSLCACGLLTSSAHCTHGNKELELDIKGRGRGLT